MHMHNLHLHEQWQPTGQCWTDAAMQAGSCAHILRDKRQLALAFTNCHLKESNRPLAPQPELMSDATFAIYTEFFTHTSDLCFHIQGEHFQQQAQLTLQQLHHHADDYLVLLNYLKALAGVIVVLMLAKIARFFDIPHVNKFAHALIAAHISLCALGFQKALLLAAAAGYYSPTIKRAAKVIDVRSYPRLQGSCQK